jgi:hypothetical protein
MKNRNPLVSTLIVCAVSALPGCAGVPQGDVESRAAEIRVYKTADLSGTPYDDMGHIWVDSWRTAFFPPTYSSEDEARQSLRAEAVRRGANGLVNVVCLDQNVPTKSANAAPAILCYGYAIRVRPTAG